MSATIQREPSTDVPIFLRKTYAMIGNCNDEIACWSEDGTTFVVKDPVKFEQTVIPEYFKHSKFSSFVRQLNFYSFRKIKYSDSIRIDPVEEKKTANYWRFRHENFQRGKPERLTQIKRMVSTSKKSAVAANPTDAKKATTAAPASSSEVQKLKKRIEEMTKNMDALTEMVQQVSLKQEQDGEPNHTDLKRKKTSHLPGDDGVLPDPSFSAAMQLENFAALPNDVAGLGSIETAAAAISVPDAALSMDTTTSSSSVPVPAMAPPSRETSSISDTEFVDQLFTAFNNDETMFDLSADESSAQDSNNNNNHENRPDPELMKRLSDALQLLPKSTQEMIVNRLIDAITSPKGLDDVVATTASATTTVEPKKVAASGKALPSTSSAAVEEPPMGMAAATLAALLHHYTQQVKEASAPSSPGKKQPQNHNKSIPVIPVHA